MFVVTDAPLRLLLLRRPPERAAGWQPVTGRVEQEDTSLEAACVREIAEETGFPPPDALEDLERETTFVGYDGVRYRQRSFVAWYADAHAPRLSEEHVEALWLDAEEALSRMTWPENRETFASVVAKRAS